MNKKRAKETRKEAMEIIPNRILRDIPNYPEYGEASNPVKNFVRNYRRGYIK